MKNLIRYIDNEKGVTFIEALVTAIIGTIVIGGVSVFIGTYSWTTKEMTALQILQQESSMISELFTRNVRKGRFVCIPGATDCPDNNGIAKTATSIQIHNVDGTILEFKISGNTLSFGSGANFRNVSTRLASVDSLNSSFEVMPLGIGATLAFILELDMNGDTIQYTETIGSVLCKN